VYFLAGRGSHKSTFYTLLAALRDVANREQAGAYEEKYLKQAVSIFENMLSFGNHLHMFSEEIASSGEQLGNTPQAFSHLSMISAAFNLDKTLSGKKSQ
jgi:GH15 family glucan-1,4-alpha-glucosidase